MQTLMYHPYRLLKLICMTQIDGFILKVSLNMFINSCVYFCCRKCLMQATMMKMTPTQNQCFHMTKNCKVLGTILTHVTNFKFLALDLRYITLFSLMPDNQSKIYALTPEHQVARHGPITEVLVEQAYLASTLFYRKLK